MRYQVSRADVRHLPYQGRICSATVTMVGPTKNRVK